jgi:hypothetical protein
LDVAYREDLGIAILLAEFANEVSSLHLTKSEKKFGTSKHRNRGESAIINPKSNQTSFRPRRKKTGGRKAGVRNKKTTVMMEAIISAAEAVGSDGAGKDGLVGYLTTVANKNVRAFCSLLGRVMPLQTEPEEKREPVVDRSAEEVRAVLRRRGLPLMQFYKPPRSGEK